MKISELVNKLNALLASEGDCDVTIRLPVQLQQARSIQSVGMGGMHDGPHRFVVLSSELQDNDILTIRAQLDAFEKSERERDPNADIWGSPEGQRLLAEFRKENRRKMDELTAAERFELMFRKRSMRVKGGVCGQEGKLWEN